MAEIPEDVQKRLQAHLVDIARLFKAPRITLVVRAPEVGNVKGDLVLTNDNPLFVERAIHAQVVARAKIFAETPQEMDLIEKEKTHGGTSPHLQCGGEVGRYEPRKPRR